MKTASAKAKGRRLAQKIKSSMLRIAGLNLEDADINVTPSGVTGEDITFSPRGRMFFPLSIECKNQEKLNLWEAIEQSESQGRDHQPVLFFTRNRSKTYAVVEADYFLELVYKGARK